MKDQITDEKLKEAFNALYGETVVVRHIQCANPQEAEQVKNRLAAGEKFETLVHTMSRNNITAPLDGELPPFSRQTDSWGVNKGKVPQGFKLWAFAPTTKIGDISDTIQADNGYHILKLERKAEPKVVKFETEKEHLRADLQERAIEQGISVLRAQLAQMARESMKIEEPTLKKQYETRQAELQKAASAEAEQRAHQDLISKAKPATAPTSLIPPTDLKPSGTPTAPVGAGTSPATVPPGDQPPATKSAAPKAPPADTKAPDLNK
jgi:hypothetical protein